MHWGERWCFLYSTFYIHFKSNEGMLFIHHNTTIDTKFTKFHSYFVYFHLAPNRKQFRCVTLKLCPLYETLRKGRIFKTSHGWHVKSSRSNCETVTVFLCVISLFYVSVKNSRTFLTLPSVPCTIIELTAGSWWC